MLIANFYFLESDIVTTITALTWATLLFIFFVLFDPLISIAYLLIFISIY